MHPFKNVLPNLSYLLSQVELGAFHTVLGWATLSLLCSLVQGLCLGIGTGHIVFSEERIKFAYFGADDPFALSSCCSFTSLLPQLFDTQVTSSGWELVELSCWPGEVSSGSGYYHLIEDFLSHSVNGLLGKNPYIIKHCKGAFG